MFASSPTHLRPAAGSSTLVTTVRTGAKVTVTSAQGEWSAVTLGAQRGWIATSKLVAAAPQAEAPRTRQTKVTASVRVTASASGKVVTKVAPGTKVTVLDTFGTWRAVKVGTKTGWMPGSQLGVVPKPVAMQTTTSLNLRASASTSAKVLVVLKKGTKVSVTATSGAWRKVTVGSRTGWVAGKYLKAVTATSTTIRTTTTGVNLRSSASTSAKVITVLAKGTKVRVTATSGVWRKVVVGTRTGWVHGSYLK